jgi:hypothetical protein
MQGGIYTYLTHAHTNTQASTKTHTFVLLSLWGTNNWFPFKILFSLTPNLNSKPLNLTPNSNPKCPHKMSPLVRIVLVLLSLWGLQVPKRIVKHTHTHICPRCAFPAPTRQQPEEGHSNRSRTTYLIWFNSESSLLSWQWTSFLLWKARHLLKVEK